MHSYPEIQITAMIIFLSYKFLTFEFISTLNV